MLVAFLAVAVAAKVSALPSSAELVARAKDGPSLLLTELQVRDLRKRIKTDPKTAEWWEGVRGEAHSYLKEEVRIPDRGAQWGHYYVCKTCGAGLVADSPTAHRCRKCGKVYSGWPWDEVYVNRFHERLKESVYKCGLVYAVDGDLLCAERVKAIMLGYAAQYPRYPLINNNGAWKEGMGKRGFSRAHSQALDEAVWLCRLLPGYDLAKDVFTDAERTLVEKNFLRLAVDIFRNDNFGIQNHECWHLSAYGMIGLLTGDAELVDAAINSRTGLLQQLEQGVDADGCWFEGSWGYHFYAMLAMKPLVTALWNLGYEPPTRFKAMFDAPFGQVTPNWELPALNNSGPVAFSPKTLNKTYGDLYDLAWLWWKDPRYAWWLGENPGREGHGSAKFLYGTSTVEGDKDVGRFESRNFKSSGFAVLRSDSKCESSLGMMPGNYVGVDYGPVGGGHGHCDKLNLVLYHRDERIAEDLGCIAYSSQRQWCWYRSSLAHNELVMDGVNQERTKAKCLWYERRSNGGVMLFDACDAYPGARVRRAVAVDGDVVLDLYMAESETEHRWEWAFHSHGQFETPLAFSDLALPSADPETKFTWNNERYPADIAWTWTERAKEGRMDGEWSGRWKGAEGNSLVTVAQKVVDLATEKRIAGSFRTAVGTAQPVSEHVELSVPRVVAKRVAFLTVYNLGGDEIAKHTRHAVLKDGSVVFSAELANRAFALRVNAGKGRPVDFRSVLLTAEELALRERLPKVIAKSAEHYRSLDAAVTTLAYDENGVADGNAPNGERIHWRYPHLYDPHTHSYKMQGILQWTAGHFPGSLWYLYEATKDDYFKDRALWWTRLLAPNAKVTTNHDIGFVMYCSYGHARRLMKTEEFDPLLIETAKSLCERYNDSLGLIRSWGAKDDDKSFKVIPDNLMNLELLEWASKANGGDASFDKIARSHADVTMRHHFRQDGGCYHVLDYDQSKSLLGQVKGIFRGQGLGCESTWSRGQAWAIYGYTMMYRETGERRYLEFARKLADYAIYNETMPEDGVPYWDYGAPGEERDSSAAAVNSSALLELADYVGGRKGDEYRSFAIKTLAALSSSAYFSEGDEVGHFLLKHGTGAKPMNSEIDVPLNYGDYYFLEALLRL